MKSGFIKGLVGLAMLLASGCFEVTQEAVDGLRLPHYCPFADMQMYDVFEIKKDGKEEFEGKIRFSAHFEETTGARYCSLRELRNESGSDDDLAELLIKGEWRSLGNDGFLNANLDKDDPEAFSFPVKRMADGSFVYFNGFIDVDAPASTPKEQQIASFLRRLGFKEGDSKVTTPAQIRSIVANAELFFPVKRFRPVPG